MPQQFKQKIRSAAYQRSVRYYVAGTRESQIIADLILSYLKPVRRSNDLYLYNYGGVVGHLAQRIDPNGLIGFAVYPKNVNEKRLRFKRSKLKKAEHPTFLSAPEVWAHLHGHVGSPLAPADYKPWKEKLEKAAGLGNESPKRTRVRYTLPYLPDPDALHSEKGKQRWSELEEILNKRLIRPYRRSTYRVWTFFVGQWEATSKLSETGTPFCIKASDGYLGKPLKKSRFAIRRVLIDLDRLGLVHAATYIPSEEKNMKGIYAYFPGTGKPPDRASRRPHIPARETLHFVRMFKRECFDDSP